MPGKKGSGGSQLSQLKGLLHKEGLTSHPSSSTKGKGKRKASDGSSAANDYAAEAARRKAKLASISDQFSSAFDTKISKPKHQVLGKKQPGAASSSSANDKYSKGITGKPAAAKSGSLAAREATLLPELLSRNKSGKFVDRRFGEGDANMSMDQKMLERFTKERQREAAAATAARDSVSGRAGKRSLFSLEDGEEDISLTHYGQKLGASDDEDDDLMLGGFGEDEELGPPLTNGNNEEEDEEEADPSRPRTKAEIMAEVMLKSKTAKHERQVMKEADDDTRRELDDQLDQDLRMMLMQVPNAVASGTGAGTGDDARAKANGLRESLVGGRKYELEKQLREKQAAAVSAAAEESSKDNVDAPSVPISDGLTPGAAKLIALATGKSFANTTSEESGSPSKAPPESTAPPKNSYDSVLRELAFERRAKPSDRLKTEEELAAEEAERLREYERDRLRRMRGEDEDEDGEGADDGQGPGRKRKRGAAAARSADDLDDDFELDGVTAGEAYGLGKGLGTPVGDDEQDEEEEDGSEDDEEGDVAEGDLPSDMEAGSDDEDAQGQDDADDEEDEHNYNDLADLDGLANPGEDLDSEEEAVARDAAESLVSSKPRRASKKAKGKTSAEGPPSTSRIPFTFPCPVTHEDLLDLLEEHSIAVCDVPTVIKRIRTLYHASLAEDNKHKLQCFLHVLVDHALYTAGQAQAKVKSLATASGAAKENLETQMKENIGLLNTMVPHIFDMSQTYTATSVQIFVSKLALMQRNLTRGLAAASTATGARTWPGFAELSFLRIAGLVWPTSDRQHPVSTPMMILMAQYLAHCRIRPASSIADMASGLYLCTLVAQFEKESRRIVPEALNFLHHLIALLAPLDAKGKKEVRNKAAEYGIAMPDYDVETLAPLRLSKQSKASPEAAQRGTEQEPIALLPLLSFDEAQLATSKGVDVRLQLLSRALDLVKIFFEQYNGSEGYIEIFTPFVDLLNTSHGLLALMPSLAGLKAHIEAFLLPLQKRLAFAKGSRRALRLQAHRALAIASYVPKFEHSGFNPRNRFDPDAERAEHAKLKALLKKERKGAVRELRRDAQFISQVKDQQRQEEDSTYKKKIDKIMSELQTERSEQKQLEKEKAKLKKRR